MPRPALVLVMLTMLGVVETGCGSGESSESACPAAMPPRGGACVGSPTCNYLAKCGVPESASCLSGKWATSITDCFNFDTGGDLGVDAPLDAGPCKTGEVVSYTEAGCSPAPKPACFDPSDACGGSIEVCACDGTTIAAPCGFSPTPWSAKGKCGSDASSDLGSDGG